MSKPSYGQKAYDRGYADAMNWKVQNHLEHFEPRTWQGLTDEEFSAIYDISETVSIAMEKVEAKLKEKNT